MSALVCLVATPRSDADRVAGLLEANDVFNTKLLVNRVRPDMIQKARQREAGLSRAASRRVAAAAPLPLWVSMLAWCRMRNKLTSLGHGRAAICSLQNDMMSVKDVQEMLGLPLLGAIPEDPQVRSPPPGGAGRKRCHHCTRSLKSSLFLS